MRHALELKRIVKTPWLIVIATVLFGPLVAVVILVSRFPQVEFVHTKFSLAALAWPLVGLLLLAVAYRRHWLRIYGFRLHLDGPRVWLEDHGQPVQHFDLSRPHRLAAVLKDTSADGVGLNVWLEVYLAQGEQTLSFSELWVQPDLKDFEPQRQRLHRSLTRFAWVVPEADLRHSVWRFLTFHQQTQFSAATMPLESFRRVLADLDEYSAQNILGSRLSEAHQGRIDMRGLQHALSQRTSSDQEAFNA